MGGTFGCIGEPLSPMPAQSFIPLLQEKLNLDNEIHCFVAPSIHDSSANTAVEWCELIEQIQSLKKENFQHFIILHGTDTLSYASAFTSRILNDSATVIFTGSQYPLLNVEADALRINSDATENLYFALDKIKTVKSGVYLAFNHKLFHARTTLKIHTTALEAFSGIEAQQDIPFIKQTACEITTSSKLRLTNFRCLNLMLQPIQVQEQLEILNTILKNPPHCLILQGFGSANFAVNAEIIECLKAFQTQNCAVVLTTQVSFGSIDQRYAVSQWVKDANILVSDCYGHADLYAKVCRMYLQYAQQSQWQAHWANE